MKKAIVSIELEVNDDTQAMGVKKSFETMKAHFGAKGIIKMRQLFLNDPFVRNLVKMKLK